MLALFNKHQSPPDGMQALGSLYVDKAQEPLAFIPMNEEEQVRHEAIYSWYNNNNDNPWVRLVTSNSLQEWRAH